MAFERIGASGESLRFRNNDWLVYRSNNGRKDIKVLRVNHSDIIEFLEAPYVGDDRVALNSQLLELQTRIEALESALGVVGSAQFDIFPTTISQEIYDAKQILLPHAPISGKIVMLVNEALPQFGGINFGLQGNLVSWEEHDLTEILEVDDDVRFIYLYHL